VPAKFLVVVVFLIEREGRVLMLRRSPTKDHAPGEWEPGSGRVESGEAPIEAVRREAREETGLDVDVLEVVDTFHYYRGPAREETIAIAFHCRAVGGELRLSPEHDALEWVPLDRIEDLPVSESLRGSLAHLERARRR
jgi:8-oxo-dGTP pyrophosphatase MutT (NUDIX family)